MIRVVALSSTVVLLIAMTAGWNAVSAQTRDSGADAPLPARTIDVGLLDQAAVLPTSEERELEALERWVREYTAWKAWAAQWRNRREPGWFSDSRQRRPRPAPPFWLASRCDEPVEAGSTVAEACHLFAEWRVDAGTLAVANARAAATASEEQSEKTTWWEHVHLDVAWPAMEQSLSLYGVVGVHATTSVKGRFEIFVAPGAMLLNVPTSDGRRAWKVATNYGITYRLGSLGLPGGRQGIVHLNLAKAWLLGVGDNVPTKSTDFIGFSMTFKKTP